MRPIVRLTATALVITAAVTLSGCGSDTSAKRGETGATRKASLAAKAIQLCVVGGFGTTMKWEFSSFSAQRTEGPFLLSDRRCIRTSAGWGAIVYNSDGSRLLLLDAANPDIGYPVASIGCWIDGDADFEGNYFSEGESWSTTCNQWRIDINRLRDTEDLKRFDVYITA